MMSVISRNLLCCAAITSLDVLANLPLDHFVERLQIKLVDKFNLVFLDTNFHITLCTKRQQHHKRKKMNMAFLHNHAHINDFYLAIIISNYLN